MTDESKVELLARAAETSGFEWAAEVAYELRNWAHYSTVARRSYVVDLPFIDAGNFDEIRLRFRRS